MRQYRRQSMSNMEGMIRNLPFKRRITPPHEKIVHEKIVFEVPYADHHFQMHGASVLVECDILLDRSDIGADLSSHPAHPLPTFELRTSLPRKCINEGLRLVELMSEMGPKCEIPLASTCFPLCL
jgi:hypothetical protein